MSAEAKRKSVMIIYLTIHNPETTTSDELSSLNTCKYKVSGATPFSKLTSTYVIQYKEIKLQKLSPGLRESGAIDKLSVDDFEFRYGDQIIGYEDTPKSIGIEGEHAVIETKRKTIIFAVKNSLTNEVTWFNVNRTNVKMKQVFKAYTAKKLTKPIADTIICFKFVGKEVQPEDTTESLGLQDDDVIECLLSTDSKNTCDAAADIMCCASCGIAAVDNVTLKKCACKLVHYCSEECRINHRPEHEEACEKSFYGGIKWFDELLDHIFKKPLQECSEEEAEARDKALFQKPESSNYGECPICCLPLSLEPGKNFLLMPCCSKFICKGCCHVNQEQEKRAGLGSRCVFCRRPSYLKSQAEGHKRNMERVKKNDPVALSHMGQECENKGDHDGALEYFAKAAELGNADAHYHLSMMYWNGRSVEKDKQKYLYHSEQAAIGGHPVSRHNLGCYEMSVGSTERAAKHWIIAANLGYHVSLDNLRYLYAEGHASKEDYYDALRAYQAALDAMKSAQREEAEAHYEAIGMNQQTTAWTKLALPSEAIATGMNNEQMEKIDALLGLFSYICQDPND